MKDTVPINQDKIRGFFLGTAIGDALGLPVESWSYEKIKTTFGTIDNYISATDHKWFAGIPSGTYSDDCQLTLAVAESMIESGKLDMDSQAKYHIQAYKNTTFGWGTTTREACANLANGVHWSKSGVFALGSKPKGFGNGVLMRCGPLGLYLNLNVGNWAAFTGMTHPTSIAVSSCIAHIFGVCLLLVPDGFSPSKFVSTLVGAAILGRNHFPETLVDDIAARFNELRSITKETTTEEIVGKFGRGTSYVYNSQPFSYAFFLRDPHNIQTLYETVSAGGDTDSNGSIVGGLLGVLNGTSIFPKHLIDGLQRKDEIIKVADTFYRKFIENVEL